MANKTVQTAVLGTLFLGFVVFGGCAGNPNAASIDESSIQTKIFQPLMGGCENSDTNQLGAGGKIRDAAAVMLGAGGKLRDGAIVMLGAGGKKVALTNSCMQEVQISGTCENCESIVAKVNGAEFATSVDQDGSFTVTVQTTSSNIELTPLGSNGEISGYITQVQF